MPDYVDSHAHLADPAFAGEVGGVVARARAAGARAIVCIGESIEAADRAAVLAGSYPDFIWHTAGIHPHDAARFDAAVDLPRIRERLAAGAVAVGECGLDYHYDNSPRERQREAFTAQLELAAECRKPVVVHTREAVADTMGLLREAARGGVSGVLHCFTGPVELAELAVASGWYVSFSGVVTFKTWDGDALIRAMPIDRILVESDAPYLAPVPHRGRRNEPAYVALTLARVAAARGIDVDEMGRVTTRNAGTLFGLAIPSSAA
jgi:TatD DNase family protein